MGATVISSTQVSASEACEKLGMNRRALDLWLQSGNCPFGSYIRQEGKARGFYYINRRRLEMYLSGADMAEKRPFRLLEYLDEMDGLDPAECAL